MVAGSVQPVHFQASLDGGGVATFFYGPGHDPEAALHASIGIESPGHYSGAELAYHDAGAAEPMTGYSLQPNNPVWASSYAVNAFAVTETNCADSGDDDGDGAIDCDDADCADAAECQAVGVVTGSHTVAVGAFAPRGSIPARSSTPVTCVAGVATAGGSSDSATAH